MKIRDRIKEFRRVKASDLAPSPKNWRTHPKAQKEALQGLLAEIGFAGAVLARETPNGLMLIDGHLRTETAADSEIPVLILDVDEAEADKILATFDPIGAMAGADAAALDALLRGVETSSEAVAGMLAELAKEAGLYQKEIKEDEAPEPPADPIAKAGDLWILGEHRVLCGDSTKAEDVGRLMGGKAIHLAFTSPPYASQRTYDESSGFLPVHPDEFVSWFKMIQAPIKEKMAIDGSFFINIKPAAEDLERLLYVFDLVLAMKRDWGWMFAEEFCWKRNGIPQRVVRRFKNQFEPIYQFVLGEWKFRPEDVRHHSKKVPQAMGKGAGDTNAARRQGKQSAVEPNEVLEGMAYPGNRISPFSSAGQATGHPASFPASLPSFFIQAFSDSSDIVYDPFLGSGSTLIAAEQLGRRCYGMEISPAYCDVIVQRWETLTGKKAEKQPQ